MRLSSTWPRPAIVVAGVAAVLLLAFGWLTRPHMLSARDIPPHVPDPLNGERLFHAGGCASCHGAGLEGGLDLPTAFGTFRVPNISPDRGAGIGGWSDLDFINAMQSGVSPEGTHYYPAFPYSSYTRMTLPDVLDLKSYMDSFAPVSALVPGHDIAFPWSMRRGIGLWKLLYLDASFVLPVAAGQDALEQGRYLVEAVGHCGECHTPRSQLGGLLRNQWLAGAPGLDGEGRVPNITPHADGLADWSERDIVRYLKSGFTPDYDTVGGSMTQVQENLARLPDGDRAAIAAYLKSLPPLPDPPD
ncbi:c-type cytochrome [Pseudomonadota bacterium]|jgi:mono/diheme cytochrome c family protein|nr:cytochrome c [Xanthomonadales bacterium]